MAFKSGRVVTNGDSVYYEGSYRCDTANLVAKRLWELDKSDPDIGKQVSELLFNNILRPKKNEYLCNI